jgi:hypothetical protein
MRAAIRERLELRKSLINRPYSIDKHGIPPEWKREQILLRLLKVKHFDGIWYNGLTLAVRLVPGFGPPEYLSWGAAVKILQAAESR